MKIGVAIRISRNINRQLVDYGLSQENVDELIEFCNDDCNCIISGGTSTGKTSF
jgi:Flp pilus assembly CpaF family ATPase